MRVFMGTAAVLSLILASTPAAARDDGLRKQVKALVKACPAAAKGYDLAALTPDGLATPDYRARFEAVSYTHLGRRCHQQARRCRR